MNTLIKRIVAGSDGRPMAVDLYIPDSDSDGDFFPLAVFVHGFKGFKDWGIWHLCAEYFTSRGFAFLAFNFSHNGTTPDSATEFSDLEAFSKNTFSKERHDLRLIMQWVSQECANHNLSIDMNRVGLIGHSRGGPIALLHALSDSMVKAVVTWASVSRLDYAWQDQKLVREWQETGVYSVTNSRTGQAMPLSFGLYQDFQKNMHELDLKAALKGSDLPVLIIHGTADQAVPIEHAENLHQWSKGSELLLVEGADHVFGGRHPWQPNELPGTALQVVRLSADFLMEKMS